LQERLNWLAEQELDRFHANFPSPLRFYQDTCFVNELYMGDGRSIVVNSGAIGNLLRQDSKRKDVEYHSSNSDTSRTAYVLIALFGMWVKYADHLRS